jgi:hypothetical protein
MSQLDAHVPQTADSFDANLLVGAGIPVTQRRPHRDSSTQQWRYRSQVAFIMSDLENKFFAKDD